MYCIALPCLSASVMPVYRSQLLDQRDECYYTTITWIMNSLEVRSRNSTCGQIDRNQCFLGSSWHFPTVVFPPFFLISPSIACPSHEIQNNIAFYRAQAIHSNGWHELKPQH